MYTKSDDLWEEVSTYIDEAKEKGSLWRKPWKYRSFKDRKMHRFAHGVKSTEISSAILNNGLQWDA